MNTRPTYENKIKLLARSLRENGKTHREIAAQLKISLGSASLWTKGIFITEQQKEAIKMRRNQKIYTSKMRELCRKNAYKNFKNIWRKNKYSKEALIKKIVDFYEKEGRIPLKREFDMYRIYKNSFGSWNNAIKIAGFQPNKVIFSKKFISNDGHKCDSFSEKIIDDYLSKNNIEHDRQAKYPGTKMTADFNIKGLFVEFFGLAGLTSHYDRLITEKRVLCKKEKINLLEIYPSALFASDFEQFFIRIIKKSTK